MARRGPPPPELLIVSCFTSFAEALAWAKEKLCALYGPVLVASDVLPFTHTEYYRATMGPDLMQQLWALQKLVAPEELPSIKRRAIALEHELSQSGRFSVPRPVNIDPGLLSLGKLVLASTKDHAHRIYLGDGIFAEVTLWYCRGQFLPWPWTYNNYRAPEVHRFLHRARALYRAMLCDLCPQEGRRRQAGNTEGQDDPSPKSAG